ncbi:hypothetical protein COL26b_014402 [Colletotrichum chrysophilum]|uniref:uncharacterized protein n=1 Tax=Colletotrichum chrysophilum TaxID=1836956 RepID=UPI002300A4FA|nr:uncharacterized protein COL26b_014402 [Colletotrichum chrysophilum]KAJ0359167.1 hypothetical protein COL26b_014402 [Colletotrichum chrysophilum]
METSISLVFWTIDAYATVVPKVMLASIAVAAMVLVQSFVIQLINITYSAKQFTTRESKRQIAMLYTL